MPGFSELPSDGVWLGPSLGLRVAIGAGVTAAVYLLGAFLITLPEPQATDVGAPSGTPSSAPEMPGPEEPATPAGGGIVWSAAAVLGACALVGGIPGALLCAMFIRMGGDGSQIHS